MGRPVIVSTHVGCAPDLVQDGETGRRFEAGNPQVLTAVLREALADGAQLARWGETGRRRIAAFSYAAASAGLLAALSRVVPASAGASPDRA